MLNAKNFGLAAGILWGAGMLIMTIASLLADYGTGLLNLIAGIYPGYSITWLGAVVGAVWGFADAFIGCYVFAWLYNKLGA